MPIRYSSGDPKEGGKEISEYTFWSRVVERIGGALNPLHSFELLKPFRLKKYEEQYKAAFLKERDLDQLETNEADLNGCYVLWLKTELSAIEKWLSEEKSFSKIIEINKYKSYVHSEIERIEKGGIGPLSPADQIPSPAATTPTTPPPAEESDLLDYKCSKDQVAAYFMQLTKFYTADQVENFLKANFKGFTVEGEDTENVYFPKNTKLRQGHVKRLFYEFWFHGGKKELRNDYIKLMIDCFEEFANTTFETENKAFARIPPSKYPFSAEKLTLK